MDQLARLGVIFDEEGAQQLLRELKAVQVQSVATEAATEKLTEATKKSAPAVTEAAKGYRVYSGAINDNNAHVTAWLAHQKGMKAVNDNAVKSTKAMTQATLNLTRQFADIGVTAASRMNPLMILIQQGPQIADAFQMAKTQGLGFSEVLKGTLGTLGRFAGAATPILAIGGALIAGLKASEDYSRAMSDAALATYGLGRASGLSGDQIMSLAASQKDAARISVKSSEDMTEAYVSMGISSAKVLADLNVATSNFAAVTRTDLEGATKRLGAALKDPEKGVDDLADAIGGFDGATIQAIKTMARQNDIAGAQAAIMKIVAERTRGAADEVTGLSGALRDGGNAWSDFWRGFGSGWSKFFSGGHQGDISAAFGGTPAQQAAEDAAESARQVAKAQDVAMASARAARAAYDDLVPKETQIAKLRAQQIPVQDALNKGEKALAAAGLTRAQALNAIAVSNKKISDLGKTDEQKKAENEAKSAAKAAKARAEAQEREYRATEATIKGNLDLAEAYRAGDAAALRSQATTKATSAAIKNRADVEKSVAQSIRATVAEGAAAGAKTTADLNRETKARAGLNQQVEAGVFTVAEANQLAKDNAQMAPVQLAFDMASGRAKEVLAGILKDLGEAQRAANDETERYLHLVAMSNMSDANQTLALEATLLNATNKERAVRLAQLQKEQEIRNRGGDPLSDASKSEIQKAGEIAGRTQDVRDAGGFTSVAAAGGQDATGAVNDAREISDRLERQKAAYDQIAQWEKDGVITHGQAEAAKAQLDQKYAAVKLGVASDFFGAFATLQTSSNRKLAAIGRAAAIAQATIDGYLAVQKALSAYPPPFNFVAAAAVGAATAINVAKIAGVKGFASGGYTGNSGIGETAGVVHGQEFVVNAAATRRNRDTLEAMNAGRAIPKKPNVGGSRSAQPIMIVPSPLFDVVVGDQARTVARPIAQQEGDVAAQRAIGTSADVYARRNLKRLA